MDDFLVIIAKLALELHPDRIASIADRIEILETKEDFASRGVNFGPNTDKELLKRFEETWRKNEKFLPRDVAFALRGASATAKMSESRGAMELAWTGPITGQIPVRHTEQALCEVIESAQRRLFMVSFVAYHVASVKKALNEAVRRQVEISVLLESSDRHGGSISHDSVEVIRAVSPSMNIYEWNQGKYSDGGATGKVHAKCAVADEKIAFITSANLTSAAMEYNMELGVIVKGGELPYALHRHLEYLAVTGVIEKLPNGYRR